MDIDRKNFLIQVSKIEPSSIGKAIALLWFYEQKQQYTERSVSDLIKDFHEDGFPKFNYTRLAKELRKTPYTVVGTRRNTFRINSSRSNELIEKYGSILNIVPIEPSSSVIPLEFINGPSFFEKLVIQINGAYDKGFYDCSLVILRRLIEALIIKIYLKEKRRADIQINGKNKQLSELVDFIVGDMSISKSRTFKKGLELIKDLGDNAAHSTSYITPRTDIDDGKLQIRRTVKELLELSGAN